MLRAKTVLAALTGVLLLCASWGDACGDKLLVVGRGVKYSHAGGAAHTASILIYKNASAPGAAVTGNAKFEENLKHAGHKVQVADAPGLDAALKSARFDLVLADPSDSPSLEKKLASQPSKPTVVPVLYEPSASELAAVEKEYGCALKAPSKDYLSAIDDIMARRIKAAGTKTAKTQ